MNLTQLEPLFGKLEQAIDNHPKLRRIVDENYIMAEPEMSVSRLGCTVTIYVKLQGKRNRKADKISGQGETPEEAVEKLISTLDFWAEAIG